MLPDFEQNQLDIKTLREAIQRRCPTWEEEKVDRTVSSLLGGVAESIRETGSVVLARRNPDGDLEIKILELQPIPTPGKTR